MKALSLRVRAGAGRRAGILEQDGLVAAGWLADGEVGVAVAQEPADVGAAVVDDLDGGAGDGSGSEAQAAAGRWCRKAMRAILSRLASDCLRAWRQPEAQSTLQAMAQDGRNPDDDGRKPDSGTVACRRNCGLWKSPQFHPQHNPIQTNNPGGRRPSGIYWPTKFCADRIPRRPDGKRQWVPGSLRLPG